LAAAGCTVVGLVSAPGQAAAGPSGRATPFATAACALGPSGAIQHVVYVQFDNTHLRRDNPDVPSDLEQIPALKNFMTSNGTLDANDHTVLISHTAGGIVSALTGLYPDRNGITVSNSYGVFHPDGSPDASNGAAGATSAFSYWTDPSTVDDTNDNLITDGQKNTPAPWVPYTRAGCDVGAFSIANMELENTKTTPAGDITKVYGTGSPEWNFAGDGSIAGGKKVTDFEGIAIHCAQTSTVCSDAHGGKPDVLPDEPGGYAGFQGLFGAAYANQVVDQPGGFQSSTQDADGAAHGFNDLAPAVNDVFDFSHTPGPATCTLAPDPTPCPAAQPVGSGGINGFPNNFNPSAAQTLGYVAAMQESGIPVTMAYIRDAHDNFDKTGACPNNSNANGPGSACYVQQLAEENQAFEAFFNRLADDGITKDNSLFVFTVDEGDHYAGGPPTNAGQCDGVTVPCTYGAGTTGPNTTGEITTNLPNLIQTESGDTTPFFFHFDDAPTVYVPNSPNGPPAPTDPKVRNLEREMAAATVTNPRTGNVDPVMQHIADQAAQKILHMQNADPLRTPSFTLFGNADYFFQGSCGPGSNSTQAGCPIVGNGFAWNHGDDNPEIASTWLGMVGPGVQNLGQTSAFWTDHTDVRPTMLKLLGLQDDYEDDGDVIAQMLTSDALSPGINANLTNYTELVGALKQLNAPFGTFGHDSEIVSTTAVQSTRTSAYVGYDTQLDGCRVQRDVIADEIQALLNAAAFGSGTISDADATALITQADRLISAMHTLSQTTVAPSTPVCPADKTPPAVAVTSPAQPFQLDPTIETQYSATDSESSVASYDVRYRVAAWNGGFGAYHRPPAWQHTTATDQALGGSPGQDYCFSVRARDLFGNTSGWSADRCTALPLDDRSLSTTTSGWTRTTSGSAYLGTLTRTGKNGAELRRTGAQLDRLALVVTECPNCGNVTIYLNGAAWRTVHTNAATTRTQVLVTLPRFSQRNAAIVLKDVSSGKNVIVDGLGISRT
jgi:hypothetical protein